MEAGATTALRTVAGVKPGDQLAQLAGDRQRWLAFLARRLSPTDAEDILHQAYEKAATRLHTLRDPQALDAWFFRVLRRLVAEMYTARSLSERRLLSLLDQLDADAPEETAACACGLGLMEKLKPQYRDILQRVDLDDQDLSAAAADLNLTVNNATVRLHRARRRLRDAVESACGPGLQSVRQACADCDC